MGTTITVCKVNSIIEAFNSNIISQEHAPHFLSETASHIKFELKNGYSLSFIIPQDGDVFFIDSEVGLIAPSGEVLDVTYLNGPQDIIAAFEYALEAHINYT